MKSMLGYVNELRKMEMLQEIGMSILEKAKASSLYSKEKFRYGTLIFSKLLMHSTSILRILPESKYYGVEAKSWDLSSVCVLGRCVMDSYLNMVYISIIERDTEFDGLKLLVWNYQGEADRVNMIKKNDPSSALLPNLEISVKRMKDEIIRDSVFKTLPQKTQHNIMKDNIYRLIRKKEILKFAGFGVKFYEARNSYFSTFIHTTPFSLTQICYDRIDSEVVELFETAIQIISIFLTFAIRDFTRVLFTDGRVLLPRNFEVVYDIMEGAIRDEMPNDPGSLKK